MLRRVVVTGMGMVTPLGRDVESTWASLREGRSGVGPITLFDASTFPTRIAAEATGFRLEDYVADATRWLEHCRNTQFAVAAATMAVEHSGLKDDKSLDPARFGIYLGSGEGQQDFPRFVSLVHSSSREGKVDTGAFTRRGLGELHPIQEAEQEPGTPAGHLASLFGARGPNANCLTACAASSQADDGSLRAPIKDRCPERSRKKKSWICSFALRAIRQMKIFLSTHEMGR